MHLKWTLTLLALATASTAKYLKADESCGDNIACSKSCYEGKFHVVNSFRGSYLGCKLGSKSDTYAVGTCGSTKHNTAACARVSGEVCTPYHGSSTCVVQQDMMDDYMTYCRESWRYTSGSVVVEDVGLREAKQHAGC
ncbi:hypothetical protein ASPWEDRAFT_181481 [Aspergillus wentii DTO 134E9]|uniref:Cyanovirin-N domain-containing protein n=1 Tax=Aspergillus wentii DTO 134E9 TaxID=1073089 RepID=A0A1L9RNR0_ASPWE|nr:uncharacterized protein ASPWEDRAFT_181481 [Aspergillus wentii DTO 134E9]KAI9934377.1 hypothetical protein MW887_005454 [Aspergillus wentii]OJJ36478.1 hypothetical protein ASPWEDRAFT_181481 [Aspergillus wentii DTO 134E9]